MESNDTWNLHGTAGEEYNTELLVHNFHPSLTKQGMRSQFLRFGQVESANVMINSRGNPVGFVRMRTVGECDRAIAGLNGRAPLHWTVKMGAPLVERQRRRREREESRRFEMEMEPITAARLKQMEEHRQRMMQLTRDFSDTLDAEVEQQEQPREADEAGEADQSHIMSGEVSSVASWPALEGLLPCSVCGAHTSGYCQACNVPYCSARCQHGDWDRHKHQCRRQLPLVVSVAGTDAAEQPVVRAVCLGRGDQPRPVPAPAPTPLRRPHSSPSQKTSPAGTGDGPVQTTPPQQQQALRRPDQSRDAPFQTTPPQQQQQQQQGPAPRRPGQIRNGSDQTTPPQQQQQQQQQQGPAPRRPGQTRSMQLLQQLGPVILRPGQHYSVVLCYAADPSAVHLRLLDQYDLVKEMEAELGRKVAPSTSPAGSRGFEAGHLCAARFEGSWYRGDVRSVTDTHYPDIYYRVHFIDWGNCEDLSAVDVAPLPPQLADIPPQAVLAALPWRPAGPDGTWTDRQWEGVRALDGRPLTASVVGTEPTVSVALFNEDGKSVLSVIGEGLKTVMEETLPPQAQLESDRKHVVAPCSMRHPQQVSAQLRDAALYRPYLALTERLQTAADAASPLTTLPTEGAPVLVRCCPVGDTLAWHRAAVVSRHGDRAVVRLLDWGTFETAELAQLRQLPQHFCQIPAIGVQFGLHGVPETACPEEELRFYRDKVIGNEFLLERVDSAEERTQARLHLLSDTNSYCFNDRMLTRIASTRAGRPAVPASVSPMSPLSAASPHKRSRLTSGSSPGQPLMLSDLTDPTLQPGDSHPFLLGQVLSSDQFFGCPLTEKFTAAVDGLESDLREMMAARPPPACRHPLLAGQLVAVRGTEDPDGWSRAAVVDPAGPEVLVRLLDVGYQERVTMERLRHLPRELARLPPAAPLLAFRGSERWSADQRRVAHKVLSGDGEETVLELTVASVGSASAATLVTCPDEGIN